MLTPHELWLRRPRCWSTPHWQAIESGKRVIRSRMQATPQIFYLQILCWSRGSIKPAKKQKSRKTHDKTTEKNNQRGRKKYIACKIIFFYFFWAYGSRGNSREFFSAHFWSLIQIFKKQAFMNRTLQLFLVISNLSLWYFARCADEFGCYFLFGSWN